MCRWYAPRGRIAPTGEADESGDIATGGFQGGGVGQDLGFSGFLATDVPFKSEQGCWGMRDGLVAGAGDGGGA